MIDDLGLLAARVTLGASFAVHGGQKAFGWFGGPGLRGAAGFMESLGLKPGARYGALAAYGELTAGTLIALGLGGPAGPAMLLSSMIVAQTTVHAKNGFFAAKNGIELGTVYAAGALALASSGYGALALDRALGLERPLRHPALTALALAGGIAAGIAVLAQRETAPAPRDAADAAGAGSGAANGTATAKSG